MKAMLEAAIKATHAVMPKAIKEAMLKAMLKAMLLFFVPQEYGW
jgi:hypothetical protein